ncbi:hypothetical protein AVEN_83244-1 [Araneus ventricosus]|uniref:RNase H type-1 domain-containing protein n=1 Tax=Araneus ventricosus TaxID=182803 RepID=A0A4Y2USG0_ARAVE|nr:hypothetical protein AVEN_83244-1 [Araneus ventricosus]
MEDKTGSAFCVMEEDSTIYEWMAQLSPFNTVFQAELLAIQEACLWASKTNQRVKGSRQIQRNEEADVLAKKATQEGIPSTSKRQETISRVCYKKSPSSAGKENGTTEEQTGVFTTFCLKSRELLLHGKGQK